MNAPDGWQVLREQLQKRCDRHQPRTDSIYYNGGTIAVLLATTVATLLPTGFHPGWVPRVLTGLATFLVALERALNFGARWRYHREMQASYENLLGLIDFYVATKETLPDAEGKRLRVTILAQLVALQRLEANIPGVAPVTAAH